MSDQFRECPLCGGGIPVFNTAYTLRLQLFAEGGPLVLTPDDLAEDHPRRMREVIEEASGRDPQELMDEVYESYTLIICQRCRREYHEQLKRHFAEYKDEIS